MAYTTIKKSSDYFNTKLYTGTGSSNAQTGVGFQPDWTWIKDRDTASNHMVTDAVRGATKTLYTQNADGESTVAQALKSFNTDGFTVGTDGDVNANTKNFASWNWKANGAGSSNTDGSINSTVSANTTSGFSIVSYTGTGSAGNVGHGLGVTPQIIIAKALSETSDWTMYNHNIGVSNKLVLNSTAASAATSNFGNTNPTNAHFTVNSGGGQTNISSATYVAYCFGDVQGYSKFGSYTGNGNTDGTFVYTGFKPAFVITKSTSSGGTYYNWGMWDTARSPSNINNKILASNTGDDESNPANLGANQNIDFLSNGFKHRSSDVVNNSSGVSYIYMAFAEQPLVGDNPATAR